MKTVKCYNHILFHTHAKRLYNKRALRPWIAHLIKQAKDQIHNVNKPDYWLKAEGWAGPILGKKVHVLIYATAFITFCTQIFYTFH